MLTGRRIAILVEEGFEDSEFMEPLRAMKDTGAIWVDEPVVRDRGFNLNQEIKGGQDVQENSGTVGWLRTGGVRSSPC